MSQETEREARFKAAQDYREEGAPRNIYPKGSLESLAYHAEFMKLMNLTGEAHNYV